MTVTHSKYEWEFVNKLRANESIDTVVGIRRERTMQGSVATDRIWSLVKTFRGIFYVVFEKHLFLAGG